MDFIFIFSVKFVIFKKPVYFRPLMLLHVYCNHFLMLRNHTGMVVPRAFHSCWNLLAFDQIQLNTYCARGLKTIWGKLQTAASDSYFWKKRNDWVSEKTTTTNLKRIHMAYPTLLHAVGTQCLVSAFLPLVCFLLVFFPGNSQFYEEDTLRWIGPRNNVWPLFWLNNVNRKL